MGVVMDKPEKPPKPSRALNSIEERRKRQAAALRKNLKKRKLQTTARAQTARAKTR